MRNTKVSLIVGAMAALVGTTACSKSEQKQSNEAAKEAAPAAQEAPKEENVIKLGQTMPYSGPASAYSTIGRLQAAFFKKLNASGGIDGKQVQIISMDDSYSPPRAVEQVRRLVETDHVTAIFNAVGTPSNTAVRPYLNEKKVAQLFVSTGASKWADPQHFPYTIGFNPSYRVEGRTYAAHILQTKPKAKIAVLYQGDDFGKDIVAGIKEGLGDKEKMIVAEATYETSDPTIDSQIVSLKASKADTVMIVTTPKFGAQAIKKISDLNWDATRYIVNVSASIGSVLVPAGLERAKGLITTQYLKDPNDKSWAEDPGVKEYQAFLKSDFPEGDPRDGSNVYAYVAAQTLVQVLKQAKGNYSAENLIKEAANLKDFTPGLLLPGLTINTSPTDFELFDKLTISSFDGESWKPIDQKNGVAAAK
ncbi:MAG: ABC transporter substrate-binding protein [Polyangiales bacterium]